MKIPAGTKRIMVILLMVLFLGGTYAANGQSIVPNNDNPKYWGFNDQPVMLLGANKTDSPYLLPDQEAYYDSLFNLGGNYTRYVVKQRLVEGLVEMFPFRKLTEGKYDLNKWNDEYWERFEDGLIMTQGRNIVVQLELWDRFDIGSEEHYKVSPWHPDNNITYSEQGSGLPSEWKGADAVIDKHPFFFSLPSLKDNKLMLELQEKYVDKILSISLKYDHILYVITNESTLNLGWSDYWAKYIQDKSKAIDKKVEVSEMPWTIADRFPFQWQQTSLVDPNKWINHVIDHPELYSFCAIQFQPILEREQAHYDRLVEIYQRVQTSKGGPKPVNAVKIFARSSIISGGTEPNAQTRFWRPLLAGWAAVSLHREYRTSGYLGFSEQGRNNLSAARKFCNVIKPWECEPAQNLLHNREEDEAYLLANPGNAYGIYFPDRGEVELEVTNKTANYLLQWISIETGDFHGKAKKLRIKNRFVVQTPNTGSAVGWVATLKRI